MNAQQLIAKFHEKGFKATSQRLAVCEAVLSSKEHPTADQVYRQVKKSHQTLSLATVYQTLHLLTEIGLLQELDFHDRVSRYDPDTSPHINVICEGCGKIEDYEAKNVKKLWSQIIKSLGFKPTSQRIDVYRKCKQCQKSGATSKSG